MTDISTISEFLLHAGTQYQIFDMGRTIVKMDNQTFLELENMRLPAPHPRQQKAWFGVTFNNPSMSKETYIWFICLPLDERGLLIPAARQAFLQTVIDALGSELAKTQEKNGQLPENPYTFVPNQNQLADFNSVSRNYLKQSPSQHFLPVWEYCKQPTSEGWQALALQGISDLAASLNTLDLSLMLSKWELWPAPFKLAFLNACEHHQLPSQIEDEVTKQLNNALQQNDLAMSLSCIRAMSQSSIQVKQTIVTSALSAELAVNQDLLTVIAARHWTAIGEVETMFAFLRACCNIDNQFQYFCAIYLDLVQIPSVRPVMHQLNQHKDLPVQIKQGLAAVRERT